MKQVIFGFSLLLFLNACQLFEQKKDDKKAQDTALNAVQDTAFANVGNESKAMTKPKTKAKTKVQTDEAPQLTIMDAPKKSEKVVKKPAKETETPAPPKVVPPKATTVIANKTIIKTIPSSASKTTAKPVVTAKGNGLTPQSSAPPVSFSNQMLSAVNALRKSGVNCGGEIMPPVKPLAWSPKLENAAIVHANDMDASNLFSHAGTDGSLPDDRIKAAGYEWERVGENIGKGYKDVPAAIKGWKESANHCKQMMSPEITEMGGAQKGSYWCQTFAKPF